MITSEEDWENSLSTQRVYGTLQIFAAGCETCNLNVILHAMSLHAWAFVLVGFRGASNVVFMHIHATFARSPGFTNYGSSPKKPCGGKSGSPTAARSLG